MQIEGRLLSRWFYAVETQPEIGINAYHEGADILYHFFHNVLQDYMKDDLNPLGREIIEACLDRADVVDYQALIPSEI